MPQQTLLALTQKILSDMDSDEVNSINDTIEATQVANTIINCFYDICEEMDLSFQGELTVLEQVATPDRPVLMKIPDAVSRVEWINYGVGEPAEPVELTPPVLSISSVSAHNFLEWTAADFGDQDVDSYDIYRFETLDSPAETDFDEYDELSYVATVSGNILEYTDNEITNESYWSAYYVKAVAEDDSELDSNIVEGQSPS